MRTWVEFWRTCGKGTARGEAHTGTVGTSGQHAQKHLNRRGDGRNHKPRGTVCGPQGNGKTVAREQEQEHEGPYRQLYRVRSSSREPFESHYTPRVVTDLISAWASIKARWQEHLNTRQETPRLPLSFRGDPPSPGCNHCLYTYWFAWNHPCWSTAIPYPRNHPPTHSNHGWTTA